MLLGHYLSRFWLACSLSFCLFAPYLSRYTDAANRFFFYWVRADLFSLLFCVVAAGFIFFLCYVLFYLAGTAATKKICEIFFIVLTGIAAVANISCMVKLSKIRPAGYIIALGIFAWIFMGGGMVWLCLKHRRRIITICMALCFIVSPLFPVFTLNALGYPSLTPDIGAMPTASAENPFKSGVRRNVYLFIFDEWSYQRSFQDRRLIQSFPNLQRFADQAMIFHNAAAPSSNTATAVPSILYQTSLRFVIRGADLGFEGLECHPLDQAENIFRRARELGFFTAMIGSAMPYGELLGGAVDFCRSIHEYKRFGDDFWGVAKYHLLTAALLLPAPLFHHERKLVAHYFFNKYRVVSIDATHNLFAKTVTEQKHPTLAIFHYMIPHLPYIFNGEGGHKDFFTVYEDNDLPGYYDNLAFTDKMIGEIVATLRGANKFEESLIIFTTDHGWRFDPGYDPNEWRLWSLKMRHVPLFIKLPFQNRSVEVDTKFETYHLGNFINRYLDGEFDLAKAERLLREEGSFKPRPLEEATGHEPGK